MSTATTVHAEDVLPVRSRINWGAIFAGAAMAFATYLVLTLLGSAIGLSIRDRVQPDNLSIGAAVWAVITMIVALFVGGCVTTQCTVGENRMEAVIHGIIMWGVFFAAMVWLVAVGVRSGFNALVGMSTISQVAGTQNLTLQDWESAARRANVPQAQIDQWRAQINTAPEAAARAANDPRNQEAAANVATAAAWWSLGGVLLSMLAAVLGALAGAGPVVYLMRFAQANRVVVSRQVSPSNP
jgi:hypothetical protein